LHIAAFGDIRPEDYRRSYQHKLRDALISLPQLKVKRGLRRWLVFGELGSGLGR